MSYEASMLARLRMPSRQLVKKALLRALFKHGGTIKEFSSDAEIVAELAEECQLNNEQRTAYLETIYKKENRLKKAYLWHRLLYRVAAALEGEKLVSRPTQTMRLTNRKEWMLTEKGFDEALQLCNIPVTKKDFLPTKSYEVQKVVRRLFMATSTENYDPFDRTKRIIKLNKESILRSRGFRQAVIEAYGCRCAVCGLMIQSPDSMTWEVQAAHIVPNSSFGRDDICNGVALCRLHHWAFDVGWFTLMDDYRILVSTQMQSLPSDAGKIENFQFLHALTNKSSKIFLPEKPQIHPHHNAIVWHRHNIFHV